MDVCAVGIVLFKTEEGLCVLLIMPNIIWKFSDFLIGKWFAAKLIKFCYVLFFFYKGECNHILHLDFSC